MIALVKVTAVRPLGGHRLFIEFSDGSSGGHDLADLAAHSSPLTAPLRDPDFFARVFIALGVLTWPNGFDLDSIQLHREMAAAGELRHNAAA